MTLQCLLQLIVHFYHPNCTIDEFRYARLVPRIIPPIMLLFSIFYCLFLFIFDLILFLKKEKKM